MKTRSLSAVVLLVAAVLFAPMVHADKTSTVLLNAVTVTGPSSAIYAAASPAETGAELWLFQAHLIGNAMAWLEISLDGGTNWSQIHLFFWPFSRPDAALDDVFYFPACGACRFRINVVKASAGNTVSVWVAQSGVLVPVVTP